MEQIRKFLRDKGFALALLAWLVAAAAAGIWTLRTVRDELDKNLSGLKTPSLFNPILSTRSMSKSPVIGFRI